MEILEFHTRFIYTICKHKLYGKLRKRSRKKVANFKLKTNRLYFTLASNFLELFKK